MGAEPAIGFANGDADAVRAVYREFGGLVYAIAFKALGDLWLCRRKRHRRRLARAWRGAASYDPTRELRPGWQPSPVGVPSTFTGGPRQVFTAPWTRTTWL